MSDANLSYATPTESIRVRILRIPQSPVHRGAILHPAWTNLHARHGIYASAARSGGLPAWGARQPCAGFAPRVCADLLSVAGQLESGHERHASRARLQFKPMAACMQRRLPARRSLYLSTTCRRWPPTPSSSSRPRSTGRPESPMSWWRPNRTQSGADFRLALRAVLAAERQALLEAGIDQVVVTAPDAFSVTWMHGVTRDFAVPLAFLSSKSRRRCRLPRAVLSTSSSCAKRIIF